jgi:glycerophosphoryl diester phosphodiesterase
VVWFKRGKRPFRIGHRGGIPQLPENSLAAFARAQELGADGVELDVQLSTDGVPVIFHDRTVDRVTSGQGVVSKMSLAELQALDLGAGQHIPTLDELFELLGASLLYNVELKKFPGDGPELETTVADRILSYQLENQCLVSSFSPFTLRHIRRHLPEQVLLGHLHFTAIGRHKQFLLRTAATHPRHILVDAAYMAWARKRDLMVNVWTADAPDDLARLTDLGVNAIIRDDLTQH